MGNNMGVVDIKRKTLFVRVFGRMESGQNGWETSRMNKVEKKKKKAKIQDQRNDGFCLIYLVMLLISFGN